MDRITVLPIDMSEEEAKQMFEKVDAETSSPSSIPFKMNMLKISLPS